MKKWSFNFFKNPHIFIIFYVISGIEIYLTYIPS